MAKRPNKHKPEPDFDPIATLRAIAADTEVAAHARVAACKTLLAHDRDNADADQGKDAPPSDAVTKRALKLLHGGKS